MKTIATLTSSLLFSLLGFACGGQPTEQASPATETPAAPSVKPTPPPPDQLDPSPEVPESETPSTPAAESPPPACPCQIRGYLIDPDTSGTNVRDTPSGKTIGQLPRLTDPEFEVGVYVDIVESRDGWLQLSAVENSNDQALIGGWVYGELIGTSTRNYDGQGITLHSKPSMGSPAAGTLVGEQTVPILACCHDWAYVSAGGAGGKPFKGWLEPGMQCASAVTNCS